MSWWLASQLSPLLSMRSGASWYDLRCSTASNEEGRYVPAALLSSIPLSAQGRDLHLLSNVFGVHARGCRAIRCPNRAMARPQAYSSVSSVSSGRVRSVSYTHLRAHETRHD